MKRDMDLIRQLLLAGEADDPLSEASDPLAIPGVDARIVARHVELLVEAGLMQANVISTDQTGPVLAVFDRLTWSGHEFLDTARNDTVWRRSLAVVGEKAGTVSFEVLKLFLFAQAKAAIGIP